MFELKAGVGARARVLAFKGILTLTLAMIGANLSYAEGYRARRSGASVGSGVWTLQFGPGFVLGSGSTTLGAGGSIYTRMGTSRNFRFAIDTGLYFRTDPFATLIPILPAIVYRTGGEGAVPYLGLAVGPFLTIGDDADISAAGFIKPGIELHFDGDVKIFAEPRFGLIRSDFVFFPHFGALFSL